jgi:membrane fusion protein (multidrug efflux system)
MAARETIMSTETSASKSPSLQSRRKLWLAIVAGLFVAVGAAYGGYWATVLRYSQSTDNAYVNGNVVQITPRIFGTVVSIGADDTSAAR